MTNIKGLELARKGLRDSFKKIKKTAKAKLKKDLKQIVTVAVSNTPKYSGFATESWGFMKRGGTKPYSLGRNTIGLRYVGGLKDKSAAKGINDRTINRVLKSEVIDSFLLNLDMGKNGSIYLTNTAPYAYTWLNSEESGGSLSLREVNRPHITYKFLRLFANDLQKKRG